MPKTINVQTRIDEDRRDMLAEHARAMLGPDGTVSDILRSCIPMAPVLEMLEEMHELREALPMPGYPDDTRMRGGVGCLIDFAITSYLKTIMVNDPKHPIRLQTKALYDSIQAAELYRVFLRAKHGEPGYRFRKAGAEWYIDWPTDEVRIFTAKD